jgi:hypothetical protein
VCPHGVLYVALDSLLGLAVTHRAQGYSSPASTVLRRGKLDSIQRIVDIAVRETLMSAQEFCACVQGIGGGLPSGNCSVATGDLAILNSQRSVADAPRFIESTEIGATPTSQLSAPLRGFAGGVGLRGSRMGSKGAGSSTGTIGLFAAAVGNSAMLRSAFDELVELWRLEPDVKRELQNCVHRCEYQPSDIVVEQACLHTLQQHQTFFLLAPYQSTQTFTAYLYLHQQ